MAYSDAELLARLIQCEAGGEGQTGMEAVASVVMNRVRTTVGEYGRLDTLSEVIFQPGQFVCAAETIDGAYNPRNIYNMRPEAQHYAIAEWAIAGGRLGGLGQALWFFNPYSSTCRPNFPSGVGQFTLRLGNHCFYDPTGAYENT